MSTAPSTSGQPATRGYKPALNLGGETVVFYVTAGEAQAAYARRIGDDAAWVRQDAGVPEPLRQVFVLDASTSAAEASAYKLMNDMMAAANFTTTEAPRFVIADLR